MAFRGWPGYGLEGERSSVREELMRLFETPGASTTGVFPPVNIYDDGTAYLVRSEIPGVDKETLEITARGDQLSIRGERVVEAAIPAAGYHRRERDGGRFRRVVTLPQAVDADKVRATYDDGILEVVLPRVAEAQARKIQIS